MLLLFLTWLQLLFPAPHQLSVAVTSCAGGGEIHLAVYATAHDFSAEDALTGFRSPLRAPTAAAEIAVALPGEGEYVFAAFHDLNGNGVLDRNLLGVPTEPYGFTRVPPTKWRPPVFGEVASTVDRHTQRLHIELRRWREY